MQNFKYFCNFKCFCNVKRLRKIKLLEEMPSKVKEYPKCSRTSNHHWAILNLESFNLSSRWKVLALTHKWTREKRLSLLYELQKLRRWENGDGRMKRKWKVWRVHKKIANINRNCLSKTVLLLIWRLSNSREQKKAPLNRLRSKIAPYRLLDYHSSASYRPVTGQSLASNEMVW